MYAGACFRSGRQQYALSFSRRSTKTSVILIPSRWRSGLLTGAGRVVARWAWPPLLLAAACGSAKVEARAGLDSASSTSASARAPARVAPATPTATTESKTVAASPPASEIPEPPRHDPQRLRQLLEATGVPPVDGRERLGLRVAVAEQGADQPWLVALVNRGSEPISVVFDLRLLALEVTPPVPPPDEKSVRQRIKPPKTVTCTLPKDMVPSSENPELQETLAPGEGLVDSFDVRLYCMPRQGSNPLVPGATVTVSFGFPEKTKLMWRRGGSQRVPLEQVPPFVARRVEELGSLPARASEPSPPPATSSANEANAADGQIRAPRSDAWAVKQVTAPGVVLGSDYQEPAIEAPPDTALELVLTQGSDARTEREATVSAALVNRSQRSQRLYFRRELLSFELSGPSGFVQCAPGPDSQMPDRQSFTTLGPGRRVSAVSRLIELCPAGALRAPGLYLVQARFDTSAAAARTGLQTFDGRLLTAKPAWVRVRTGWGELPAQRAPQRISLETR